MYAWLLVTCVLRAVFSDVARPGGGVPPLLSHWRRNQTANDLGKAADVDEFPFLVYIKVVNCSCSGFLLTDTWVMTASYCVEMEWQPQSTVLVAGTNTIPPEGNWVQLRGVARVVLNSNPAMLLSQSYDSPQVALLEASWPFALNSHVNRVAISAFEKFPPSQVCRLVGFAEGRDVSSQERVRWKKVKVLNGAMCSKNYGVELGSIALCSLGWGGRVSCRKDIGAPLVCGDAVVIGIVTMRAKDTGEMDYFTFKCALTFQVNVYTAIGPLNPWIVYTIPDIPSPLQVSAETGASTPQLAATEARSLPTPAPSVACAPAGPSALLLSWLLFTHT